MSKFKPKVDTKNQNELSDSLSLNEIKNLILKMNQEFEDNNKKNENLIKEMKKKTIWNYNKKYIKRKIYRWFKKFHFND